MTLSILEFQNCAKICQKYQYEFFGYQIIWQIVSTV